MSSKDLSIEERISRSSRIFTNVSTNIELSDLLAKRGFGNSKMAEGEDLFNSAKLAIELQVKEYSEKYAVSVELNEIRADMNEQCSDLFTITRIALEENSAAYNHLKLNKRFRQGQYNWHEDATAFVDRLLSREDAVEAVGEYGYTVEDLTAIQNGLKQIDSLQAQRLKEAGEAEQATKDRDAAMDLLDSWMDKFFTIAPIALRSQPQWLEQLGIVVH